METSRELSRFVGRWHAQIGEEKVFLEFMADGRLFYTGLWGEDTKEFSRDMRHPLEFGRQYSGPTWELHNCRLLIVLKPKEQFEFEYSFSEDNRTLTLTSLQTHESLSFSR